MHWKDIPKFPTAHYGVDVSISYLEDQIQYYVKNYDLDLSPDFQRTHVWTEKQQIAYVEYFLKGGDSSRDLYFNHPGWQDNFEGRCVIVDGKQRLEAVRAFLRDDIKVFDHKYSEIEGSPSLSEGRFRWNVACLKYDTQVLEWYLAINSGGTPHTEDELNKVRGMLMS